VVKRFLHTTEKDIFFSPINQKEEYINKMKKKEIININSYSIENDDDLQEEDYCEE